MIDIRDYPVMSSCCASCPFKLDANGIEQDAALANIVRGRLFSVSQICHHPSLYDKPQTHLCRGARDYQLMLMHRLRVIAQPTDEAWDDARNGLFDKKGG